ncbi:MAG: hypothetical protein L0211_22480 [Planctomycetaceae bacterium]|nr:hypothetical protein [Planctomycetaceae bacterium]
MFQKIALGLVLAIGLIALLQATAVAADKTHDGIVVSAAEGKLVMTDKDGKNEHSHTVAATTKVTLDGKDARLVDLKKGDAVKVTTDMEGKVLSVAATRAKG